MPFADFEGIILKVLFGLFGLFFAYIWLYMGIAKKAFIELNEEGISLKTIFSYKKLKWTDNIDVGTYYMNNNTFIGLMSKSNLNKRKDNFITALANCYIYTASFR